MRLLLAFFFISAAGTSKPAEPINHTVKIDAFQFQPSTLTVKRGDKITFTNADATPHTVTPTVAKSFTGIDRLLSGESGEVVILKAGSFDYFCELHTTMKGKIIVK